jgi:hypothetical protein
MPRQDTAVRQIWSYNASSKAVKASIIAAKVGSVGGKPPVALCLEASEGPQVNSLMLKECDGSNKVHHTHTTDMMGAHTPLIFWVHTHH